MYKTYVCDLIFQYIMTFFNDNKDSKTKYKRHHIGKFKKKKSAFIYIFKVTLSQNLPGVCIRAADFLDFPESTVEHLNKRLIDCRLIINY